ncbi:hypothetical protein BHM03_00043807 [Ensete ventricosum]|nr:hypothetical protein BHM03_00043807 [Ensete ventricosum]
MTTEIWRSMQYKGSEIMREVAWVIFDEVHYMRDRERGVVWEESIVMAPKNSRFVFLSATVPNAKEFADWVHRQPCHIVYTDYRPTPLQHYIFPSGGNGLYMVVDEKGKFREDSFQKALNALVPAEENKRDNGKWQKALLAGYRYADRLLSGCTTKIDCRRSIEGEIDRQWSIEGEKGKEKRKRRKKKRRRRKKYLLSPRCLRPCAAAALTCGRFFSRTRRRNVSLCKEKDRGDLISKVRHLVSYRHIELNSVCLEDVAEALCSCFFSLHGEKKRRFLLPAIAEAYTDVSSPYVGKRNVVFFSPRSPKLILPTKPRRGSSPVGDRLGSSRESSAGSSGSPFSSPSADTA